MVLEKKTCDGILNKQEIRLFLILLLLLSFGKLLRCVTIHSQLKHLLKYIIYVYQATTLNMKEKYFYLTTLDFYFFEHAGI